MGVFVAYTRRYCSNEHQTEKISRPERFASLSYLFLIFCTRAVAHIPAGAINEATVQRSKPYPNKSEVESSYL